MISWLVIIGGLVASLYYADLFSAEPTYSVWAPLMCVVFSIALCIKLVLSFEWARARDDGSGSGVGGDDGGIGGG